MMLTGSKMPCFREGADFVLSTLQDRPVRSLATHAGTVFKYLNLTETLKLVCGKPDPERFSGVLLVLQLAFWPSRRSLICQMPGAEMPCAQKLPLQ